MFRIVPYQLNLDEQDTRFERLQLETNDFTVITSLKKDAFETEWKKEIWCTNPDCNLNRLRYANRIYWKGCFKRSGSHVVRLRLSLLVYQ
jgi:hypothetical protein